MIDLITAVLKVAIVVVLTLFLLLSPQTMRPLLLALVLFQGPAMAQPCGLWGNRPEMLGGCTVNDSTGRPAVRITEPYPGTGYRLQPVPGYRPVSPAPTFRPYGGYIGAPPSYPR